MASFTITSFNALWGLTTDHVPFDLPAVIDGFDSDVISLQEVWDPAHDPGTIRTAAEALGYQVIDVPLSGSTIDPSPEITTETERIRGTWGVALLSRLPIRSTRIVDLGRLIERWDVANRYAVLAEIEVGSTVITATALHLSFALPNAAAQLRRLSGYLPRHQPSVVAGDCNLWGPLVTGILARHRRAVKGRTWPAVRPHSQLDHILCTDDLHVEQSGVLPPAGSDHRPIFARLRPG